MSRPSFRDTIPEVNIPLRSLGPLGSSHLPDAPESSAVIGFPVLPPRHELEDLHPRVVVVENVALRRLP
ncbi:MAG: hypothetical protein ACUVYA_18090, partial [Planctomycetota bacterium]